MTRVSTVKPAIIFIWSTVINPFRPAGAILVAAIARRVPPLAAKTLMITEKTMLLQTLCSIPWGFLLPNALTVAFSGIFLPLFFPSFVLTITGKTRGFICLPAGFAIEKRRRRSPPKGGGVDLLTIISF